MTIINLMPFLKKKRRSNKSYGQKICCPICDSYDFWRFYSKQHIDGHIYVVAAICFSDECDGDTVVEFKDGIVK